MIFCNFAIGKIILPVNIVGFSLEFKFVVLDFGDFSQQMHSGHMIFDFQCF